MGTVSNPHTDNMKKSSKKSSTGGASPSNRLQGNLPSPGESQTRDVSEPSARSGQCPEDQLLNVSHTSGAAKVQVLGPERQKMLPSQKKRFSCPDCAKNFSDKSNMKRHQKTVHQKKKFQCLKCDRNYSSWSNLKKHESSAHDSSVFQCPLSSCANMYATMPKLQQHVSKCCKDARIRKCACKLENKFGSQYCLQMKEGGKFKCTAKPTKHHPKARQASKEVQRKQRVALLKKKGLRAKAAESIRFLLLPHPNLHPRVAFFRKRYGYPAHKQVTIPWIPMDPGMTRARSHRIMLVLRQFLPEPDPPPRPPLPPQSTVPGKDMPILVWDDRPVDRPGINLDLLEDSLDFEP